MHKSTLSKTLLFHLNKHVTIAFTLFAEFKTQTTASAANEFKIKTTFKLNFSSCINVLPGGSAVRAQVQGARQHGELRRVRGRTTEDTRHGEVRQGVCRFLKSQPQTSVPGTFERRQTFNPNKIPYYIYIHVSSHKAANTQQKAPFFSRRFVSKNYTDVPPSVFVHICNILFHYLIFFKVIFLLSSRIFCFPFFCTCY